MHLMHLEVWSFEEVSQNRFVTFVARKMLWHLLGSWDVRFGGRRAAFWRVHAHHHIIRVSHWKPRTIAYNCRVFTPSSSKLLILEEVSHNCSVFTCWSSVFWASLPRRHTAWHLMPHHLASRHVTSYTTSPPYHTSYEAAHHMSHYCALNHTSHFTSDQISHHATSQQYPRDLRMCCCKTMQRTQRWEERQVKGDRPGELYAKI